MQKVSDPYDQFQRTLWDLQHDTAGYAQVHYCPTCRLNKVEGHDAILQGLDRKVGKLYFGKDRFVQTIKDWNSRPIIFSKIHPDPDRFDADMEKELTRIQGGITGDLSDAALEDVVGKPRLNVRKNYSDDIALKYFDAGLISVDTLNRSFDAIPRTLQLIADKKLSHSSAFRCPDDGESLYGVVKPHHVLDFEETPTDRPVDAMVAILNKENSHLNYGTATSGRYPAGSGGNADISKSTKTIGKGTKQEVYSLNSVEGSELQVVTNDLGQRSVATFLVPSSEQGKGYGQSLLTEALKDGDIRTASTGGVSDAYRRVQDKLVSKGVATLKTDEYGVKFISLKKSDRTQKQENENVTEGNAQLQIGKVISAKNAGKLQAAFDALKQFVTDILSGDDPEAPAEPQMNKTEGEMNTPGGEPLTDQKIDAPAKVQKMTPEEQKLMDDKDAEIASLKAKIAEMEGGAAQTQKAIVDMQAS